MAPTRARYRVVALATTLAMVTYLGRVGTRFVLARVVIWWSALTAATAVAFNDPVMLIVRFLFGARRSGRMAVRGADVFEVDAAH